MEEFRMKTNTLERMDRRPGAVILIVLLSVMTAMPPAAGELLDICESCHANATCDDKLDGPGKTCNCMYGFVGNGRTVCLDKDECQLGSRDICGPHTSCHNTFGSYFCTCLHGYSPSNSLATFTPNDGTHCQDVDECQVIPGVCGQGARCVNLDRGFECRCLLGYRVHNATEPFHPLRDHGSCKVVDCGRPPTVDDTVVLSTTGTQYGGVVLWGCREGFVWRRGDNSSTCGADGAWSEPGLLCEARCGLAPSMARAELVWYNASMSLHRCVDGYHSWRGSSVSVCGGTGEWQKATLKCIEVKPAINDLHVFNEKCVRWRAEKYEHDKEIYKVVYRGVREYQGSFRHEGKQLLSSEGERVDVCLSLLPATNYTVSITALSARFTASVTTNTSLQVPQAPVILYREFDTPMATLRLQHSAHTLDAISVYQVFVVPLDGMVVFDCASRGSPDFLSAGAGPSSGQYVTGQFPIRHMRGKEMNFTLGDGRYHGGFFNAPLTRGRNYYVILRVVSRWKEAFKSSCVLWAKITGTSYVMKMSSLWAAGSVGVLTVVVLLGYSYTWFFKRM